MCVFQFYASQSQSAVQFKLINVKHSNNLNIFYSIIFIYMLNAAFMLLYSVMVLAEFETIKFVDCVHKFIICNVVLCNAETGFYY